MSWPPWASHVERKFRIFELVGAVVALAGLIVWDALGRPAILDPWFVAALVLGGVAGWSLVRAIRDGREKRRRVPEDRR